MSHPDDQRDPAAVLPDPAAAEASSWRLWAALAPDHPVWAGRLPVLCHPPTLEWATAGEFPSDAGLFQDTTH